MTPPKGGGMEDKHDALLDQPFDIRIPATSDPCA